MSSLWQVVYCFHLNEGSLSLSGMVLNQVKVDNSPNYYCFLKGCYLVDNTLAILG